jgi:hypothetical protein
MTNAKTKQKIQYADQTSNALLPPRAPLVVQRSGISLDFKPQDNHHSASNSRHAFDFIKELLSSLHFIKSTFLSCAASDEVARKNKFGEVREMGVRGVLIWCPRLSD